MSRKLDRRCAEIMGHTVVETDECNGGDNLWLASTGNHYGDPDPLPFYSSDLDDAWLLVEWAVERGKGFGLSLLPNRGAVASFTQGTDISTAVVAHGDAVPGAVTRAFLKAAQP